MRCCSGVSALDLGVIPPRSSESCFTHRLRAFSPTFKERLASATVYPWSSTRQAASCLNSDVKDRRFLVIRHLAYGGNITTYVGVRNH
tara:strand:+ start:689 stop:952 length:264 start_codon:yes stop_codon:yes gene_type:complete